MIKQTDKMDVVAHVLCDAADVDAYLGAVGVHVKMVGAKDDGCVDCGSEARDGNERAGARGLRRDVNFLMSDVVVGGGKQGEQTKCERLDPDATMPRGPLSVLCSGR